MPSSSVTWLKTRVCSSPFGLCYQKSSYFFLAFTGLTFSSGGSLFKHSSALFNVIPFAGTNSTKGR